MPKAAVHPRKAPPTPVHVEKEMAEDERRVISELIDAYVSALSKARQIADMAIAVKHLNDAAQIAQQLGNRNAMLDMGFSAVVDAVFAIYLKREWGVLDMDLGQTAVDYYRLLLAAVKNPKQAYQYADYIEQAQLANLLGRDVHEDMAFMRYDPGHVASSLAERYFDSRHEFECAVHGLLAFPDDTGKPVPTKKELQMPSSARR